MTTRAQPDATVRKYQTADVPPTIRQCCNYVEILVGALRVNDTPLLSSALRDAYCETVGAVVNMKCITLEQEINNVVRCCRV